MKQPDKSKSASFSVKFSVIPRRRKLRFILFLITTAILSGLIVKLLQSPRPASAAWADFAFFFRKTITFNNPGAEVTNQKIKFDIDTQTLISENKMQPDCDDSKFVDANGQVLKFFLDSVNGACNTDFTDYWALIPTIYSGNNTIYFYYGNPSAINRSEPGQFSENTFDPSSTPTFGPEEKNSVVLYWGFNEGYGPTVYDNTSQANNGTLGTGSSAPTYSPDSPHSPDIPNPLFSLKFDGSNDYVSKTYSSDTELDPGTASFSVALWFKHPSTISGTDTLLARFSSGGYKLYMNSSGYICFGIDNDGSGFPADSACTTTSLADSKWHFLEAVKNGTTSITLYIDGLQRTQTTPLNAGPPSRAPPPPSTSAPTIPSPTSGMDLSIM